MSVSRDPMQAFAQQLSWVACNSCALKFSANTRFLVLSCSHIACSDCANKYSIRNPANPSAPQVNCPRCKGAQQWRGLSPNMEPQILRNFLPGEEPSRRYRMKHMAEVQETLERSIMKNRAGIQKMRDDRMAMQIIMDSDDAAIAVLKEKISKYIDPYLLNDLLTNYSTEQLQALDIQPFIRQLSANTSLSTLRASPLSDTEMGQRRTGSSTGYSVSLQGPTTVSSSYSRARSNDSQRYNSSGPSGCAPANAAHAAGRMANYHQSFFARQATPSASSTSQSHLTPGAQMIRRISPSRRPNITPTPPPPLLRQLQNRSLYRDHRGVPPQTATNSSRQQFTHGHPEASQTQQQYGQHYSAQQFQNQQQQIRPVTRTVQHVPKYTTTAYNPYKGY